MKCVNMEIIAGLKNNVTRNIQLKIKNSGKIIFDL